MEGAILKVFSHYVDAINYVDRNRFSKQGQFSGFSTAPMCIELATEITHQRHGTANAVGYLIWDLLNEQVSK
jgi:hypothetical protein